MKSFTGFLAFLFLSIPAINAQSPFWKIAAQPWPESFGSQRAVMLIGRSSGSAEADLTWRRHDRNPASRRLLVIEAATGDTVKNVSRLEVNAEHCHIVFGPVTRPGIYHLYYLPFEVVEGYGYYSKAYLKPESAPDQDWLARNPAEKSIRVQISTIECRTGFDSFYPMEIIPKAAEKDSFLDKHPDPVLYFTEGRENPVRMKDEIPWKWIQTGPSTSFSGTAMRNEYLAFQAAVFAARTDIRDLTAEPGKLTGPGKSGTVEINLTCFNTQGVDPYGNAFTKKLDVPKGRVQPLWIGADVPEAARPGTYTGKIRITGKGIPDRDISVTLEVTDRVIPDRGDNEPWRHSRLRWLNSTAGSTGNPIPPYRPIARQSDSTYIAAGHRIRLAGNGLPESIRNGEAGILASPVTLTLETENGTVDFPISINDKTLTDGKYVQQAAGSSGNVRATYDVRLDYDGYLKTRVTFKNISGSRPLAIQDVLLRIPLPEERAKFMMGMGLPGCAVPPSHESKWKGPSDSFWIGDTKGGIWCELRGSSYHGPLLNLYHPAPPESWNNGGKGGFRILNEKGRVTASVYSGNRTLNAGDSIAFEWAMLITPVKECDVAGQFTNRYYHSGDKPAPVKGDFDAGVKIINVHHANVYNPFINYPFIAVKEMRSFIDSMHAQDKKVKIYYTVRELTNHVAEVWALRSLGYEILENGGGGGYPWLSEHFVEGYTPQWYQHFPDGRVDASVLSAPGDSRWLNYYIEGLAWLVRNVDIDGLYLDDVTFDRRILQRMRTVMAEAKPGCLIDLHSNTGFSIGPANQYAEFFPYVDKLWFGESFQYDKMSAENWLVEVSGIPFGLMGDMLQGGGNRWLGMVFGMTVRYPWTTEGIPCDPRPVWKIWDEFGIRDSKMSGFWDAGCPVTTGMTTVKATAYLKPDRMLVSVGNFSDEPQTVKLLIDWEKVGIDPKTCHVYAPEIENFQPYRVMDPNQPLTVEPRKGWLIYIEGGTGR